MSLGAWLRDTVHRGLFSSQTFEFFQRFKINITKNYHYSPIPDARTLREKNIWQYETKLYGLNLREAEQLAHTERVVSSYRNECDFALKSAEIPYQYYMRNGTYGWLCATIYHSLIRYYKPRKLIEIGAGSSTYVSARAAMMNKKDGFDTQVYAVDPFPSPILQKGFPGLVEVLTKKAEDLAPEFYLSLEDGDILFIDSTHTVKTAGDVTYLFLEILPRLNPGVLIHVHDIFWPQDYPRKFLLDNHYFWAEQYLLQAFLAFNEHFEILWAGNYLPSKYPEKIQEIFPLMGGVSQQEAIVKYRLHYSSNSFWMRRVKS
jgi:hypothetical protein